MIKIVSTDGIGRHTSIVDAKTGEDLSAKLAVSEISFHVAGGRHGMVAGTATLVMMAADVACGRFDWLTRNPASEQPSFAPVAEIIFRNGDKVVFNEDGTFVVTAAAPAAGDAA